MSGDSIQDSSKFCLERDHEIFYAILHCTFYNCDQKSRRVCASCLFWKIHQHGQSNTNHIIKEEILIQQTKEFKEIVQYKVSSHIDNLKNQIIKQQNELYQFLNDCSIIKYINSHEFIYNQQECLVQIEKLIGIIKQFQIVLQISFQQFKKDVMSLNQHILKEKSQDYQIWEQGFCFQEVNTSYNFPEDNDLNLTLKPQHQNIPNQQMNQNFLNQHFETQIIIHNKELVRAKQNTIQIFDLENKSMKKQCQIQNKIVFICFNRDNTILFFGDFQGFVYGYRLNKEYSLLFKRKIHSGCIQQIYSIYDEIISICDYQVIKITNFRNGKLIFKHKISFNSMVNNLNYDYIQGNIITNGYNNILILNRSNHRKILDQKILELQNTIMDMEYVQPNYLIYLLENVLKKIEINYQERKLVCFKEFSKNTFAKLISFSSVDCGNKIILTSEDNIYILNQNLIIQQQIPINSDKYLYHILNFKVKQINSMDKIIIIKNGLIRFLVNLLGQNHRELQIRQQLMFPRKLVQLSS